MADRVHWPGLLGLVPEVEPGEDRHQGRFVRRQDSIRLKGIPMICE